MKPWYTHGGPLVLASISPRRKSLLESIGIPLIVHPSGIVETGFTGSPEQVVMGWAERKAHAVAPAYPRNPVLGADTMVFLDGEPLGKPRDTTEAADMLGAMSGRWHSVFGGVCIVLGEEKRVFHRETRVLFRDLSAQEIIAYVDTGEPMDKAGAYGAQGLGGLFVREIRGCWFNVVGLPLPDVVMALRSMPT
ncbi:MAG: Maf family protein [Candidatus Fermentibacteraceae bacterium]